MDKKGEFIDFIRLTFSGKTKKYAIQTKSNSIIGHIQWYGAWRKYCFFPAPNTIWDSKCMNEVQLFITELHEERKK